MGSCKNVSPKRRKLCIGSMNTEIQIQKRDIGSKGFDDPDYQENFLTIATVWAAIKTSSANNGYRSFDGVGYENATTHKFYIRYDPTLEVSSDNWVLLEDNRYEIKGVENLEEKNEFLILSCEKTGDKINEANDS